MDRVGYAPPAPAMSMQNYTIELKVQKHIFKYNIFY